VTRDAAPFVARNGDVELSDAPERLDVDAHALYARVGFAPLAHPERLMEIHRPDLYRGAGG